MALGVWLIVSWMVFMVVIGVVLFAWGWRSGQFRDVESSKRTMLEDREPEPWPRAAARPRPERERGGHMSEAPLRVDWLTFWIVFATAVFLVWSIAATLEMSSARRRSKAPPEKGELTPPGPSAATRSTVPAASSTSSTRTSRRARADSPSSRGSC